MRVFCKILFLCLLFAYQAQAEESVPGSSVFPQWSEQSLQKAASMPVQYGGRVMPLSSFARIKLLTYSGKTTLHTGLSAQGEYHYFASPKDAKEFVGGTKKMSATEWLLNTLLYPELAANLPVLVVDNTEVIDSLNIEGFKVDKKRGRYSAAQIKPALSTLIEQGQKFAEQKRRDKNSLTKVQEMTLSLANRYSDFARLVSVMGFAREQVVGAPALSELIGSGDQSIPANLYARYKVTPEKQENLEKMADLGQWDEVLPLLPGLSINTGQLALFAPPADGAAVNEIWLSASQAALLGLLFDDQKEWAITRIASLESLEAAKSAPDQREKALLSFIEDRLGDVKQNGQLTTLQREVRFNERKYFSKALFGFILTFIVVALSWLGSGLWSRYATRFAFLLTALPLCCLLWGIFQRCLIRARPPVSNLYETILFITAVVVALALIIEWIGRRRIALAVAPILGAAGMFLANRYELVQGGDTMEPLRAVLDTNFWLATHVIIINIGYAGGVLAAAIAHIYIFARLLGVGSVDFYRSITKTVYGVVCFCLFFSLVGTVLGGIWGNESWGRFWGWDPKENGALMIVIWSLVILHARLGGYIREMGVHLAAVFLGSVVVFSWFGVNNLGIGLHSYGFTSGLWKILFTVWIVELAVILLGMLLSIRGQRD